MRCPDYRRRHRQTAILREFSKYEIDACLIEKKRCRSSRQQSQRRLHPCRHGFVAKNQKHHYLRRAVEGYEQLANDLGDYVKHGQTLVFTDRIAYLAMPYLLSSARKDCRSAFDWPRTIKREPNISKNAKFAVFSPEGAVISPHNMVVALAENAIENGSRSFLIRRPWV